MAESRRDEGEEHRDRRLSINQQRMAESRRDEGEEHRDRRLYSNQQRMFRSRNTAPADSAFKNPLAAFSYSPTTNYSVDPAVQIGTLTIQCTFCEAKKYRGEAPGMCCSGGKVKLPNLEPPPPPLRQLLLGETPKARHFLQKIRLYNSAFQMTSFGATREIMEPGFRSTFKVCGQVYHQIGPLNPLPNKPPKFLQIYFMGNQQEECEARCQSSQYLDNDIVQSLQDMLHEHNTLVQGFKTVLELPPPAQDYKVVIRADKRPAGEHARRFNAPTTNEVAILLVGDPSDHRDIVLHSRERRLQHVSETHRSYDALQYPLIFWRGQDGYHFNIPQVQPGSRELLPNKKVSANDFYAYMIMVRGGQMNPLLHFRDLFLQFLVDMYAKVEGERLLYIRQNQKQLRSESYVHLRDAVANDGDINNLGQLVVLPSTFTGGPRYMHERTQDAMTYVRTYGRPDLFITFTCNPHWNEIKVELLPGQQPYHRQDLIARVFHQKLLKLVDLITKFHIFGATLCHMYTIEWQKRGLPHAHMLIWLKNKIHPQHIDSIISAELPDPGKDPELLEVVKKQMVHGPCGHLNNKSPCMAGGKCTKGYPRPFLAETQTGDDGYPSYRRRKPGEGGFKINLMMARKKVVEVDNRWIVPYCPLLTKTFEAHINVEFCNSVRSIKYVCKYVNKGCDQAMVGLQAKDEVTTYQMARYISSNEAAWRLFSFPLHQRHPTVVHLAVHLENGQRIYFNPNDPQQLQEQLEAPRSTTLTAFFELCCQDPFASTLLYNEVPQYYTWQRSTKKWKRRAIGQDVDGHPGIKRDSALGRVYTVHPNNFECFYLRLLLHTVRGPTSFQDLKRVEGQVCDTYRQACQLRGLLEDDSHWNLTLAEASVSRSAFQLRNLFAIMLHTCDLSNPRQLWETHKESLGEDILHRVQRQNPGIEANVPAILNEALILLQEKVLQIGGDKLTEYGLPEPENFLHALEYEMLRETSYNLQDLERFIAENEPKLLQEQRAAYDAIIAAVGQEHGSLFFLDAPGGTGKTFLINLLLAKVRLDKRIALAVASSGIAATLLTGGRTAHSTFKLPMDLVRKEPPLCNISRDSPMANVLRQTRLIVWDECTMSHRRALEAVDRTLQDLMDNDRPMGGITLVLAGDFRQTLPVIPKGTRADELRASIKCSPLWRQVRKLHLTTNMRAHLLGLQSAAKFSEQLLSIGDGTLPFNTRLQLHELPCGEMVTTVDELKAKVFPDLDHHYKNPQWLCERAILAPRNAEVDKINLQLLQLLPGRASSFWSIDTVVDEDEAVHFPTEFLNSLQPPGLPPHNLILKPGAPIMLLRNLDPPRLCNGTRLVVKTLMPHVIEATIITANFQGEDVFLPRIPLTPSDLPFKFKRLQFPVRLSFALSINKSQGQSLKVVGLNLETPCFSHGQLYVGCSRVGTAQNLYICSPKKGFTENSVP